MTSNYKVGIAGTYWNSYWNVSGYRNLIFSMYFDTFNVF